MTGERQMKQLLQAFSGPYFHVRTPRKEIVHICFQEVGGKFGKRVSETLLRNQPPNIEYDCSTSGKIATALVLSWMRKVLQPELKGA